MGKRKADDPPKGSPAWMATFSDLMNLLLCFFVLLFSMSSIDEQKYEALVAAMNNSFSIFSAGATAIGDGVLVSNGVSQLNELDDYINSTGKTAESDENVEEFKENNSTGEDTGMEGAESTETGSEDGKVQTEAELQEALEEMQLASNEEWAELIEESVSDSSLSDQVDVSFTSQYVKLTMKGAILFESGSADLKKQTESVLNKVGVILEKFGRGSIEIEGHTDNVPIKTAKFPSNEELSAARALSVFYYLCDNTNLDPATLKHVGMGDRNPVADNSTEEGRAKNRRVEILIFNPS